jgi:hypothetical protein
MEMQEMIERLLAGQAKAEADREQMLARMNANMKTTQENSDADRKADREELKRVMNDTQEIRAGQEHMQGMFRTNQEKMDAWLADRKNDRKETTACHMETCSLPAFVLFFNLHSGGWSPNWVHSARRPFTGLLYLPPRVIVTMENLVE